MSADQSSGKVTGLRFNAWNLLLLIPLLILIPPLFNMDDPRLFGMPFFYWFQLVFVVIGVVSVGLVYLLTRKTDVNREPDQLSADDLDQGVVHED